MKIDVSKCEKFTLYEVYPSFVILFSGASFMHGYAKKNEPTIRNKHADVTYNVAPFWLWCLPHVVKFLE
jgi:hypothetical protein